MQATEAAARLANYRQQHRAPQDDRQRVLYTRALKEEEEEEPEEEGEEEEEAQRRREDPSQ